MKWTIQGEGELRRQDEEVRTVGSRWENCQQERYCQQNWRGKVVVHCPPSRADQKRGD